MHVHLARDDRKVVCTLQRLMQGCHKLAATFQGCNNCASKFSQPRNFHMCIMENRYTSYNIE